ncbi:MULTISPECIES: ABC transporter permease [Brevibacillus]|uniref:ABC transporter permease n=1 Tax=Brevibacillus laterosporus TaxID=1465 RepID=A0AAP3DKX1_BRELA|nr:MULTISPECIES: ABC transporter permease [Brevibacillus]ATO48704.1 peptide ABC transporter [Brevibacillus laterosporus DSM 25]AYB41265.1 ABC transporter permease [Brevibacillus laterosporus]MBG9773302.1 peptide ABC transporter [Brevibacillus laterosporus]MBG9798436.1 peptide ABC transporter [Brevibacillus laterosporus]MBG9800896.1 peptide ABC transporter [Brevibacillus laterosporus]
MMFVIKRLLLTIPILLLVSIMTFSLIHMIPGDPARVILGQEATPEAYEALRTELGLDKPIVVQYVSWLGHVVTGDLGISITDRVPVSELIAQRLPATIELTIGTFLFALVIAVPTGILAAVRRNTWIDYASSFTALGGMSIPSFWLAMMAIIYFSVENQWLPSSGYVPFSEDPKANVMAMILPCMVTGLRESAMLMRMLRSSLVEVVHMDFVRTAKAKGLNEIRMILGHALRNALIPVVTTSGLMIAGLLGGLVITESIFSIPGFGRLIVESVFKRDYVTVQGAILVSAVLVVAVNLLVDLLYAVIDPRIKAGKGVEG